MCARLPILTVSLLLSCASSVHHFDLAAHWAPVWYQDVDARRPEAEYITAVDFDSDRRANNNWENFEAGKVDLSARIYYAIVETGTHWFITYADYHPLDWEPDCSFDKEGRSHCHENDMEGAMVVVLKDGSSMGQFALLYTRAHSALHAFTNDPQIVPSSIMTFEVTGVTFEDQTHPELYIEPRGHGVCALWYSGPKHCTRPARVPGAKKDPFLDGDGIVYRYKGRGEVPKSGNDRDVGYELVPIETTLWRWRNEVCKDCLYDRTFVYHGTSVPLAFDGDTWGQDRANPPWGWDDPRDGDVLRGDLFFDPARSLLTHFRLPWEVSTEYEYNPYFAP